MTMLRRATLGLLVASALALPLTTPASAAEIPTGAARIVEKVQTHIFIAKSSILYEIGLIQANAAETMANK